MSELSKNLAAELQILSLGEFSHRRRGLTTTQAIANSSSSASRDPQASNSAGSAETVGKIFHPFRQLPAELRTGIWRLAIIALPGRRIWMRYSTMNTPRASEMPVNLRALNPHPAIANVCQEARGMVFELIPPFFKPEAGENPNWETNDFFGGHCNTHRISAVLGKDVFVFDDPTRSHDGRSNTRAETILEIDVNPQAFPQGIEYFLSEQDRPAMRNYPNDNRGEMTRHYWDRRCRLGLKISRWANTPEQMAKMRPGSYEIKKHGTEIWGKIEFYEEGWQVDQ